MTNLQKEHLVTVQKGIPRLEYVESMPILHLFGSYSEMGEQYGSILNEQLNSLVVIAEGLSIDKKLRSI